MINVGKFAYDTLRNSTALTALVSADSIFPTRPEVIVTFPSVYYVDEQNDAEFVDNLPTTSNANITIHVFIRDDSPYSICKVICDLMKGVYWSCVSNIGVPDPETAVRHQVMIFTKMMWNGEV